MKKFQKTILFIIIFSFMWNFSIIAFSYDEIGKFHENQRITEIFNKGNIIDISKEEIEDLVQKGLTQSDAVYYLKLNNIVSLLEQENIEVLIDDEIEDISDRDFINNKRYYQDKILHGDKAALKKALKSIDSIINGSEYTERIISTFSHKESYEIIYPDGAKIIYNTKDKFNEKKSLIERNQQKKENKKIVKVDDNSGHRMDEYKNTNLYKPVKLGYEETIMDRGITYAYENVGSREGEWSFESGLAFSKVYLYTEFQLGEDRVSTIKYARGGQSSYGIVNIANSTGATISRAKSSGEDLPAEARNEVIFTVSGSFGATFLILSLSVEPGMNWTQYIIFRLYETKVIDEYYGAEYEWYAAEYK